MSARIISGSSVHNGGLECEIDDCLVDSTTPATTTAWRIRALRTATWLCCDRHRDQLQSSDGVSNVEWIGGPERWLYLPLLLPSDAYACIAVEELLYSLAAFGAACAARTRVDSHPRCGFDVYGFGTRKTKTPCRARATQLVEEWVGDEGGDLYLCDKHAKTLKRRERDAGGVLETELVLDFGGGG